MRPGEKLHEEMISFTDGYNTIDLGLFYAIIPSICYNNSFDNYLAHHNAKRVPEGFYYNSGQNDKWETIESIRKKITENIDSNFEFDI